MTNKRKRYDYCILGAGLAGLSLADVLQAEDQSVIVLEKNDIGHGASGTPGGLVNPATGCKGKKSWKAEACYLAIRDNLEKIQKFASLPFYHWNGVLRPAQTEKMARKMKAKFDETDWPDGWCHWLTEREIKQKHPGIHCVNGGLWLPIGMTVNVKKYVTAYADWLKKNQITVKTKCNVTVKRKGEYWLLKNPETDIKCDNLIYATGLGSISSPFWKVLNLEAIKGQVARFRTEEKLPFIHSVSGLGYVARLHNEKEFVQGSTYEHNFENLDTDKGGADYLHARLTKMLPNLSQKAQLVSQWSGVRISAPNRKPVVGMHPEFKNLHLFTGLGSKGLLYSKFVAQHFADHLLHKTPLFEEVDVLRLFNH